MPTRSAFLVLLVGLTSFVSLASCDSPVGEGGSSGSAGSAGNAGSSGSAGHVSAAGGSGGSTPGAAGAIGNNGGSSSAEGGAAGAAGAGAGSSTVGAAGAGECDDGDPTTTDFFKAAYGCGHLRDSVPSDSLSWIVYDVGFSVDPNTGLGWIDLTKNAGSSTLAEAQAECDAFSVAGLADWRIPTIDDARTLAAGCAPTASGGTCPIHDPSCLTEQCGYGAVAECESCKGGSGPGTGNAYCNPDASICAFFHTSSLCSDCTGPAMQDWEYGPTNGNFAPADVSEQISAVCVMPNVPGALP